MQPRPANHRVLRAPSCAAASAPARRRRRAFTLIELLVSLAVLTLALSTVAVVFKVTTDTATQAAAFSEVNNWLRRFTADLEADLDGIVPSESILMLRGRTVPAALTPDDLAANKFYRVLVGNPTDVNPNSDPDFAVRTPPEFSNPRADLMMFITKRAQASAAPPTGPTNNLQNDLLERAVRSGAMFAPILVAYGHAAQADVVESGSGATARFVPEPENLWSHINAWRRGSQLIPISQPRAQDRAISMIPAQQWILARRATLLINDEGDPSLPSPLANPPRLFDSRDWGVGGSFNPQFFNPSLIFGVGGTQRSRHAIGGDVIRLRLAELLFKYQAPDVLSEQAPTLNPYRAGQWGAFANDLYSLLYPNRNQNDPSGLQHFATVLRNPPTELRSNLALQALPGCAWFQVEFLMPEDPRNSPDYFDPSPQNLGDNANRFDPSRWVSVECGQTYVFVPDTATARQLVAGFAGPTNLLTTGRGFRAFGFVPDPDDGGLPGVAGDPRNPADPNLANRRIRMWPYAMRITVRVFDPRGRLPEPLVRSFVHRFD